MPERRVAERIILYGELHPPASTGIHVRIDPVLAPETPVFLGMTHGERLRPGLAIHCSDVRDLHNLSIHAERSNDLTFALVLDGRVDVSFGPRRIGLGSSHARCRPEAAFIALAEPEPFVRRAWRGKYERKVSISFSREWLAATCPEGEADGAALFGCHLGVQRWTPTPRAVALAEQLIRPPDELPLLRRMHQESRTIELVAEALRQLLDIAPPTAMHPREWQRIGEVRELLDSGAADGLSLADIARSAGSNASTLQRQFRIAFGMTIFDYLRRSRLLRARQALEGEGRSIAEAADLAGYTSPANFSTAYRRQFGITPRQSRAGF